MSTTVTIELPDEIATKYEKGASLARKELGTFLADRLINLPPFLARQLPPPLEAALADLERRSDSELWQVTEAALNPPEQREYDSLLTKNRIEALSPDEQARLAALGNKARQLTLQKAQAFMLLQWRGHTIPTIVEARQRWVAVGWHPPDEDL